MAWTQSTAFSTLYTEVLNSGFQYLSDASVGLPRVKRWCNQSMQELCALEDWPFVRTTLTFTTNGVSIPDLRSIIYVRDLSRSGIPLIQTTVDTVVNSWAANTSTTGVPVYWYVDYTGGLPFLRLYPGISGTGNLDTMYYKNPVAMSLDADVVPLPDQFVDVVVLGAVRRGLIEDGSYQDAAFVKQEWQDRVNVMRSMLISATLPHYQEITPDNSGDW